MLDPVRRISSSAKSLRRQWEDLTPRELALTLLLAGPVTVALFEQVLARFSTMKLRHVTNVTTTFVINPVTKKFVRSSIATQPTIEWHRILSIDDMFNLLLFITVGVLVALSFTLARRLRPHQRIRDLLAYDERLLRTVLSFIAGTTIAAAVRFYFGDVGVADFANACAPIVAALIIAAVVDTTRTGRSHPSSPPDARQVALLYILVGAVATALGNLGSHGWFFGSCYLVIFGSLTASSYFMLGLVLES